jgi:two-component system chemotaxis response regulator CheY
MNDIAGDTLLKLPEILDLTAAENFLETVRQHAGANTLCMDASDVRVLTVPCVQILLAAARSHAAMSVSQPSDAFVGAFEDLGIDWMHDLKVSDSPPLTGENVSTEEEASSADEPAEAANAAEQPELNQISEKAMSKRILTIDDSKTMRDMLMLTLVEAGFDVTQAVDGQDGLEVLQGMESKPDVIITDINMPRMDGYEVIRNLRKDPSHKSTPILVLTTESETEKKNLAREAGATGWMVKPFDPERLIATVRKVAP